MMLKLDRRLVRNVDWPLLATALTLAGLGLVTLWGLPSTRQGSLVAWRQVLWLGLGLLALVAVASVDYRTLVRAAPALYLVGIGLLVTVLVLGRAVAGARRWIPIGPVTLQPAELFKLIFVLTLVWALTRRWANPRAPATPVIALGFLVVPFLLVVRQPDLGTALVLLPVAAALLFGAGVRLRVLGWLGVGGLAGAPLAWFFLREYQRERLLVYMDPLRDPLGSAYNVIQAKIAIGSGQLLGTGIAGATQSRLLFLPERHTDFIFAVFAEMWGFAGTLVLIVVYALLLLRGFEIAAAAREPVGRLLALGVTALLGVQTLTNLGMVTGLLPIVGLPLPLMSYGGSSLVVTLMAVGLLLSVKMRRFL
jgi:rod shape determining protein RodA